MAFLVYSRLDQNRCRPNTIKLVRLPLPVPRHLIVMMTYRSAWAIWTSAQIIVFTVLTPGRLCYVFHAPWSP